MRKKRFIILFTGIILAILIVTLVFNKPIIRLFKKSKHLQLFSQDVSYAEILCGNRDGMVKITSEEGIKKLVTYLNKLELINESSGENEYDPDKELNIAYVFLFGSLPDTAISIWENYLSFSDDECWECGNTDYYIVDSEYNSKSGKNKVFEFLDELANEFGDHSN